MINNISKRFIYTPYAPIRKIKMLSESYPISENVASRNLP